MSDFNLEQQRTSVSSGRNSSSGKRLFPTNNCYLKLVLDDVVLDELHQVTTAIRDASAQMEQVKDGGEPSVVDEDGGDNTKHPNLGSNYDSASKKDSFSEEDAGNSSAGNDQKRKRRAGAFVQYKPMCRSYLHITLFFGGEHIAGLTECQLKSWHSNISALCPPKTNTMPKGESEGNNEGPSSTEESTEGILHKMGVARESARREEGMTEPNDSEMERPITMKFKGLSLFPPRRNNLIVAIFDAPTEVETLRSNILSVSSTEGSGLEEVSKKNAAIWKPHITLGRINSKDRRAARNAGAFLLEAGIKALNADDKREGTGHLDTKVHGITMGGPIPDQADLDWDIRF